MGPFFITQPMSICAPTAPVAPVGRCINLLRRSRASVADICCPVTVRVLVLELRVGLARVESGCPGHPGQMSTSPRRHFSGDRCRGGACSTLGNLLLDAVTASLSGFSSQLPINPVLTCLLDVGRAGFPYYSSLHVAACSGLPAWVSLYNVRSLYSSSKSRPIC